MTFLAHSAILSRMDFHSLNFTSIAGLTAIGAILATCWRHVMTFGRYLIGIVIGTSLLKDEAGNAVMAYAFHKAIRSPLGVRVFGGFESYVHPKRWTETVAYEGFSTDPVVVKFGRQFALVSLAGQQSDMAGEYENRGRVVTIRYFRWFFDIEKFTLASVEHYNAQKRRTKDVNQKTQKKINNRFRIVRFSGGGYEKESGEGYGKSNSPAIAAPEGPRGIENMIATGACRLLGWKREDLQQQPEEGQSPFTGYPFPNEIAEGIQELELWLSHEKWFRSKSIPWRRGWLLYGPPGSGKSTLVRALGMTFDLPVFIFDLSGMTNDHLCKAWEEMMQSTPCIALIEDIDNVYHGREYVGSKTMGKPNVTFDCLLNCISGVKQADGVFLMITTNHVDKLDPAIGIPDANGRSTRPGRIDKALMLGLMAREQRIQLAKHILTDFPELVDETVEKGEGETAAQFQARCAQLALSKFWAEKRKLTDETPSYVEAVHFDDPTPTKGKWDDNKVYGKLGNQDSMAKITRY